MSLIGKRVEYSIPAVGYGLHQEGKGTVLEFAVAEGGFFWSVRDRIIIQDEATNQLVTASVTNCIVIESEDNNAS